MAAGTLLAQEGDLAEQLRLGNEAMRAGQADKAATYFQTATTLAPRMAEVYMNLGLAEEQLGHQKEAADAFAKAIHLKPLLPGAHLFLGIADYRLNRLDESAQALLAEVSRNPKSSKALLWLGVTYLAQNKPDNAAAILDQAAKLDPKDLDIMYHRGRAHLLISKNAYLGIFEASPNNWRVHQVLAEAYQESDRYADAITEFKLAIQGAPTEPGLHDRLGEELWRNGMLAEADQAFSDELNLDPNSITALYHLGRLRVTRTGEGQIAEAIDLLNRALAQDPTLSQVEYYLGRGTAQLNRNDEAIRHYQNAIKGDKDGDTAQQSYYQLAHIYRQMKRPEEAKDALANFARLKQQADADQKKRFESRLSPETGIGEKEKVTENP